MGYLPNMRGCALLGGLVGAAIGFLYRGNFAAAIGFGVASVVFYAYCHEKDELSDIAENAFDYIESEDFHRQRWAQRQYAERN